MREELLALLEERPYASADLAGLLAQDAAVVHRALLALQRSGDVKRVGTRQDFALPSFVAKAGRRIESGVRETRHQVIRAALAKGPLPTEALAIETQLPKNVIKHECARLQDAGELVSIGKARGSRWHLAGTPIPEPVTAPDAGARLLDAVRGGADRLAAMRRATGLAATTIRKYVERLCLAGELVHVRTDRAYTGPGTKIFMVRGAEPTVPSKGALRESPAMGAPMKSCRVCGQGMVAATWSKICPTCRPRKTAPIKSFSHDEIRERGGETSVCAGPGCGQRFPAAQTVAGRFCSTQCAETPAPSGVYTRVIDGVEYEVESLGGKIMTNWPHDDIPTGSSLSGGSYQIRRSS